MQLNDVTSSQTEHAGDIQALESLLVSEDFARLTAIAATVRPFNFFDVASLRRREEVHTRLLSFLLDSRREHGLGDVFARCFTERALGAEQAWHGGGFAVYREWRYTIDGERGSIDVLLVDYGRRRVLIIENKIDSSEHGSQLSKYWQVVTRAFDQYTVAGIFLRPNDMVPSDSRYVALGYDLVCVVCEQLLTDRPDPLLPDTHTLLDHYAQLLRREFVGQSDEVKALCHRIHTQHGRAIELLLENQRTPVDEVVQLMFQLVSGESGLYKIKTVHAHEVGFVPDAWLTLTRLQAQQTEYDGWIIFFDLEHRANPDRMLVYLWLDQVPHSGSEQLYNAAITHGQPFAPRRLDDRWMVLYEHTLLEADEYGLAPEERDPRAQARWHTFITQDLPRLRDFFVNLPADERR